MYTLTHVKDFDFSTLHFKPLMKTAGEKGAVYADCICSFDIETTRIIEKEQSVMYVWQFAIEENVIFGRTWCDFKDFIDELKKRCEGLKLICFVHNLSYEIVFLSGIYNFKDHEVFCLEPRKVLKATMHNFLEFRCSYKLTNLSLAAMTKRYNKKYLKQSGDEFDYSKRRFSSTPLSDMELKYIAYDVLGVVESVHEIMRLNDKDLYNLPLTSTGFVRNEIKEVMAVYRWKLLDMVPSFRCYQLLRSAFRGGNTHCNRFYAGDILECITSYDISSSYPSQLCNKKFPMSPFKERVDLSIATLEKRLSCGAAVIMRVEFRNLKLRDPYEPVPYIPIAKCIWHTIPDGENNKGTCYDNGRLLQGSCEMCVTDQDFYIIMDQYECTPIIKEMYTSWYDYLPDEFREKTIDYFVNKTKLKGVEGEELFYFKNKELL